ncbi:MAG: hypothetical protein KF799_00270 [Bdellovibrionales bacterium]|nr:hypothetical protein [Bdellovibrionales bacterium]
MRSGLLKIMGLVTALLIVVSFQNCSAKMMGKQPGHADKVQGTDTGNAFATLAPVPTVVIPLCQRALQCGFLTDTATCEEDVRNHPMLGQAFGLPVGVTLGQAYDDGANHWLQPTPAATLECIDEIYQPTCKDLHELTDLATGKACSSLFQNM